MHNPKYDDWEVLLTAGNTDGTDGIMRACLDRGDYLLVEEFGMSILLLLHPVSARSAGEGLGGHALPGDTLEQRRGGGAAEGQSAGRGRRSKEDLLQGARTHMEAPGA